MREDCNGKALECDDRVIIVGDNKGFGNSNFRDFFRENQVWGKIKDKATYKAWTCASEAHLVDFSGSMTIFNDINKSVQMKTSHLRKLDPEEYIEFENKAVEASVRGKVFMEECAALVNLQPAKVSWMDRTFNIEDKIHLNTNLNWAALGGWDRKTNAFSNPSPHYQEDCCAFTKNNQDIEVYIPDIWLRYYEWTPFDLVEWMQFLSKCEIGFEFEYFGQEKLSTVAAKWLENSEDILTVKPSVGECSSLIYPNGLNGWHKLRIKGHSAFQHHTYLRFICLRYLYNHRYWTIPGHAMQIKRELGATVTHWQALLMAHLYQPYYAYYNLVSQADLDPKKQYDAFPENHFSDFANFDRHVNPFQKVEDVLNRLESPKAGMNYSFEYTCDTFKRDELKAFFDKKDYIGLYNYVTKKQKEIKEGSKQWRLLKSY